MLDSLTEKLSPSLLTLRTRPLFTVQLNVEAPTVVGKTPDGDRRIGVIAGGRFEGERLSGQVLHGGSDWQTVREDGSWTLDVRAVLKTTDGALIGMTYNGIRHGPPDVLSKISKGEPVDAATYYFRTNPMFETAAPSYLWMNRILAIGIGHRLAEGPVYNLFEVL
jgi:hypothetical protein